SLTKSCVQPPNTTMGVWSTFDYALHFGVGPSRPLAVGTPGIGKWGSNGPPVGVTGKVGNALSFNGIDQFVEASASIVTNFGPGMPAKNCKVGGIDNVGAYSACMGDFSIDTWIQVPPGTTLDDLTILDNRNGPIWLLPCRRSEPKRLGSPVGGWWWIHELRVRDIGPCIAGCWMAPHRCNGQRALEDRDPLVQR